MDKFHDPTQHQNPNNLVASLVSAWWKEEKQRRKKEDALEKKGHGSKNKTIAQSAQQKEEDIAALKDSLEHKLKLLTERDADLSQELRKKPKTALASSQWNAKLYKRPLTNCVETPRIR